MKTLTLFLTLLLFQNAEALGRPRPVRPGAAPSLTLGQPVYQGNGCPDGTVSSALSPDGLTLSVLFDRFSAQAGPSTNNHRDMKMCRLRIPLTVTPGYQVMISKTDWRGFVDFPAGVSGTVSSTHSLWARNRMIDRQPFSQKQDFVGPVSQDFVLSDSIQEEVWSPCGDVFSINIGATMKIDQNMTGLDAVSYIDSVDLQTGSSGGVVYQFQWRKCVP